MRRAERLLAVAALAPWLGACAHGGATVAPSVEAPVDTPGAPSEEWIANQIRVADAALARGLRLADEGDHAAARESFDAALDALLTLPGGARVTPAAAAAYDRVVTGARDAERAWLLAEELAQADALAEQNPTVEAEPPAGPPPGWDFPAEHNAQVERWLRSFTGRERAWFAAALARSGLYLDHVHETFDALGIPRELAWVALVESAFKPHAYSRAHARGVWQFISSTGRRYGLDQDFWVDERSDPEKSTRAAGRYLQDLYALFGDWNLALAAYNGGERRVQRAISRYGTDDFWRLARTRGLALETRNYVPRIHAAILIAREPERYGFGHVVPATPEPTERIALPGPVDLAVVGDCIGRPAHEIKQLNPSLRRNITPLHASYELHVPEGLGERLNGCLATMPAPARARYAEHVVRPGDTLSGIAARYGSDASAIASANGRRINQLLRIGTPLVVPIIDGAAPRRVARAAPAPTPAPAGSVRVSYRVKAGDTLSQIAAAHGTTVSRLKRWNGLRSSRIRAGSELTIYAPSN